MPAQPELCKPLKRLPGGEGDTMIAGILRTALNSRGWSVTEAAARSGIDRPFLSRLLNGQDPPRTRDGRRTAEHDDRYRKIAVALGLDDPDGFVEMVARIQRGQPAVLPVPIALRHRYPAFEQQIADNQPLRHRSNFMRLMKDCLVAALEGDQAAAAIGKAVESQLKRASQAPFFKTQYVGHDYLGIRSNHRLPSLGSQRARLCRQIGDALVELCGSADDAVGGCVHIARLFHDLALLERS